jgi:pyruvate dehydrogenase E2 component (dihydrolipoamide acetyltransferase)
MSAAIHAIAMPKWGMAMNDGTVTGWLVREGARVAPGQEIVEVESTKAASALEAREAGVLRRQIAAVGAVVPVGGLIGVIAGPEVPDAEIDAFIARQAQQASEAVAEAAPQPRRVQAGARSLNILEAGAGDPPVLLIHGFGGNLESWSDLQGRLAENRRVIAFDLPGHGDSDATGGDWSIPALAAAARDLLDALAIDKAHLVAHSLGGAVAIALARLAPERVASLTLIGSAGLGPEIDGAYVEGFLAAKRRKDLKPVIARLFSDERFVTEPLLEQLIRMKRIDGVEAALRRIAAEAFPGGRQALDLRSVLSKLIIPVRVIWGEADAVIPAAHAEGLGASTILPGIGHMAHVERPAQVAALLRALIEEAERAPARARA